VRLLVVSAFAFTVKFDYFQLDELEANRMHVINKRTTLEI